MRVVERRMGISSVDSVPLFLSPPPGSCIEQVERLPYNPAGGSRVGSNAKGGVERRPEWVMTFGAGQ
jgi:hypothetical protein